MILPEIGRIADAVERDHWMRRLAKDLDTSLTALEEVLAKLGKVKTYGGPAPREEAPTEPRIVPDDPDREDVKEDQSYRDVAGRRAVSKW